MQVAFGKGDEEEQEEIEEGEGEEKPGRFKGIAGLEEEMAKESKGEE